MATRAHGRDDLLGLLDEGERHALERRGRRVRFPAGTRILHQGEPGDRVVLILGGRAKISYTTRAGRELVLRICGPGELVGELAVIDDRTRLGSVVALEPVEALVVPASELRALLHERPALALELLRLLSLRFRDADLRRVEFGAADTTGRVAARLVELADRYGEPEEADGREPALRVPLPLSQEELAAWTGASRAAVTGALRVLRELGWIETERRAVVVHDLDALRARASVQN